ncbi:MAG: glycosyltransferase [Elusimicrobia bacterium]|nr:glycosyltransferase [Elusimicrobiota bacterium]
MPSIQPPLSEFSVINKQGGALLLYGYEPSGHAAAAEAIQEQFKITYSNLFPINRVNISSDLHPILGPAIAKTYLKIIQKTPALWEYLYDNRKIAEMAEELRKIYLFLGGSKLRNKIRASNPDLIICTHALPCGVIASEKQRGNVTTPLVAVLTDFAIHTYWIHTQVDLYLVPTPHFIAPLMERGVPEHKIQATGIPIHPNFQEPTDPEAIRKKLGFSSDPVLFLSGGSKGMGSIEQIIEVLLHKIPKAQILIPCATNKKLLQTLQLKYAKHPQIQSYPFLSPSQMKELLYASDLLIGKAGGMTLAEALSVGLPMVFLDPLPGQEDRNADFLVQQKTAIKVQDISHLGETISALLRQSDSLEKMRYHAKLLGCPNSTQKAQITIAQKIKIPSLLDSATKI